VIKKTLIFLLLIFYTADGSAKELLIYVGVTSKPPMQKIISLYHKKTGTKISAIYGGSGTLLSQIILTKKGDIYMPGSPDFMRMAEKKGVVAKQSVKKIAYLIPSLIVPKDNPKAIGSYDDLTKPGIKIVIANPQSVSIGVYAAEIIDKSLKRLKVKKNIINYTGSASKAATAIMLHQADAAFDWKVYSYWNPKLIEAININKYIVRISYISAGILNFTKDKYEAQRFLNFLSSSASKKIFEGEHIITSIKDVYKIIGRKVPVGGFYKLPKDWLR